MGFTVSGLTNYVDQSSTELIAAAQFKSETAALANIQTGVKSSAALQILTVSPIPQDGSTCGFTASGDVAFTQRNIEAKSVISPAPLTSTAHSGVQAVIQRHQRQEFHDMKID